MTYLLIMLTLFGWGIAGIFDKKAVHSSSARSAFICFHLFGIPVIAASLLLLPHIYGDWQITPGVVFWEGCNAIAALTAILCYFYAMSKAQASWVFGITAGYPIVGQLLATPLTGEPFSFSAVIAAAIVSAGVALIGYSGGYEKSTMSGRERFLVIGAVVLTTVLWGVLGIFEKRSLEFARPFEAYLVLSVWKVVLCLVVVAFFRARAVAFTITNPSTWGWSWLSAALVAAGNIGFIVALSASPAGYLIVMTAGYPLVMYVFAVLFLKERINFVRAAGIALIVFGAVAAELARGLLA